MEADGHPDAEDMTLRVLMLNGGEPSVGGRGLAVQELSDALQSLGVAPTIVDVRRWPKGGVPRGEFDVVHTHGYQGTYWGSMPMVPWRDLPRLATLHGWLWRGVKYRAMNALELRILRSSSHVIVQNDAMREFVVRHLGSSAPPIHVQLNGLDLDLTGFPSNDDPLDRQVSLVWMGRIAPEKRLDLAIEAVSRLPRNVDWTLNIVGPISDRASVRRAQRCIERHDVGERIRWWGRQEHPWRCARADFLLHTSNTEGGPRVVVEAIHLGVPVVATSVGAIPQLLEQGAGVAVEPNDVTAFATALSAAVERRAELLMQAKARRSSVDDLSWPGVAQRYLDLYEQMLRPPSV